MKTFYRNALCGELNANDVGKIVELSGWVDNRRNLGGVLFIDLRDRSGKVQLVINEKQPEAFEMAEKVRNEFVLNIKGEVVLRSEQNINKNLPTGEIEVEIKELTILDTAETPPIYIEDNDQTN